MTDNTPILFHADFDRWISQSWRTDRRYYQVDISQDLFGAWVLKRSWGGLSNHQRNSKTHAFAEYEEALKFFGVVARKRQKRGYVSGTKAYTFT